MADWRFKQGWDNNNPSMQEVQVLEVQADGTEKPAKGKVIPIVIQSSDDEPLQIYVHKKRQPSKFPRRFEIQRTEVQDVIEYQPYRKWQEERLLKVQETMQWTTGKESGYRALLGYKILGSGANKFVCELYLEERLKKYAAEDARKQEGQQLANLQERRRVMRYFQQEEQSQNRLIKCYRSNKKGHTAKNCLIERPMFRCINCLGNHPHSQCSIMRCFRCNEQGHLAKHCFSDNLICSRCGMNGHITQDCGAIILQSKSKARDGVAFDREDIERVRCLAGCANPNGHFNCHTYASFPNLKPYKNADRPRPMRSQLLQTKMCFTDCDGELAFVRTIPTRSFPHQQKQRRVSKW